MKIFADTNQLSLVTYEQAKRLKEFGFNWSTFRAFTQEFGQDKTEPYGAICTYMTWDDDYYTRQPDVALALKWFRDVKGMIYHINPCFDNEIGEFTGYDIHIEYPGMRSNEDIFSAYEAAESALLDEF